LDLEEGGANEEANNTSAAAALADAGGDKVVCGYHGQ